MEQRYNLPARVLRSQTHELAYLRATLEELSTLMVNDLAKRSQIASIDLMNAFEARRNAKVAQLFAHYCEEFGFDKDV